MVLFVGGVDIGSSCEDVRNVTLVFRERSRREVATRMVIRGQHRLRCYGKGTAGPKKEGGSQRSFQWCEPFLLCISIGNKHTLIVNH